MFERVVDSQCLSLRKLASGNRAAEVAYGAFLANPRVTVAGLIEGSSDRTRSAEAGRHFSYWASVPGPNFHLLTRMMKDRATAGGGTAFRRAARWAFVAAREATLGLRYGEITIVRPQNKHLTHPPRTTTLRLVEVVECSPRLASSRSTGGY